MKLKVSLLCLITAAYVLVFSIVVFNIGESLFRREENMKSVRKWMKEPGGYLNNESYITLNEVQLGTVYNGSSKRVQGDAKIQTLTPHRSDTDIHSRKTQITLSVKDCENKNLLVFYCGKQIGLCGGLGDRQKGLVSVFLLSILTNRIFQIVMERPCDISNYLQPNVYDWHLCHKKLIVNKTIIVHRLVDNSAFRYSIPNLKIDNVFNKRIEFVSNNEYWVDEIKKRTAMPWIFNISTAEIFRRVLQDLFKPKENLQSSVDEFLKKRGDKQLVCSHIRIGQNPSIPNDTILREGRPNVTLVTNYMKRFNDSSKYRIFVASDSDDVKRDVKSLFGEIVLTIPGKIVHMDKPDTSRNSCQEFYNVLLEQYILSRCELLILTRSNFGVASSYMRNTSDNLYCLFNKRKSILPCRPDSLKTDFGLI